MADTADQVQWLFPSNPEGSKDACARCEAWIVARGLPQNTAFRTLLIVEELFTNSIRHGSASVHSEPVRVGLEAHGDGLTLHYADYGVPFDPTVASSGVETASLEIGGQGLRMIQGLSRSAFYQRKDGWNQLRLTVK